MSGWGVRVLALLALAGSYYLAYDHGRAVERQVAATASAQRDSSNHQAEAQGERDARQEEHRGAQAQEEARAYAHDQRVVAAAGGTDADAAGQRLHHDAAQFAAAVGCPSPDTAAIARGQNATRAAMVLSDLLARSVDTNRELAKAYDDARIVANQCAAEYDAVVTRRSGSVTTKATP